MIYMKINQAFDVLCIRAQNQDLNDSNLFVRRERDEVIKGGILEKLSKKFGFENKVRVLPNEHRPEALFINSRQAVMICEQRSLLL